MNQEDRKRYAQLDKDLVVIYSKMNLIEARHKKTIWMDKTFDKDRKDILRNAELTLRLADDKEFQALQEQARELERQQGELNYSPLEDIPDLKL